jgi:hypothetical protein
MNIEITDATVSDLSAQTLRIVSNGPARLVLAKPSADRLEAGIDQILRICYDGVDRAEAGDVLMDALVAMYGPLGG